MSTVFRFTFLQQVKSKTYIITTLLIAVIIAALTMGVFGIINAVTGNEKKSDIDYVYISDSSILSGLDYNIMQSSGNENFKDVKFINFEGTAEEAAEKAASESDHAVAAKIKNKDNGNFEIKIIRPEGFAAEKKSAGKLGEYMNDNLRYVIYEKSGITDVQMEELMKKSSVEMSVIGEDGVSEDTEMIKNVLPAIFGIMLYMIVCIYGQNVAREVVLEKDSKMMETLLVMTKPYSLIFGKILGIYLAALLQMAVWICSVSIGLTVGLSTSGSVGEDFREILSSFAEKGGFSAAAVIFALISLMTGFLLYIAVSALAGTFASKTEEVNAYYSIVTMIIVVCWMFPYINSLNGNEHILNILRYIPFTAPFTSPADILLGNMNPVSALISTVIVTASAAVVVFLAAKVYKAMVLYRGEPPKLKDIIKIVKKES